MGDPILEHGREVLPWWPPCWGFSIRLGPYCIPQHNPIGPLFLQKKIGLSLLHLVPEMLGPKMDLIFHQNVFCIKFLLDFRSNWPPFSLMIDLSDPSFVQNRRSDWTQFVIACWAWLPKTFVKSNQDPPPPQPPHPPVFYIPVCSQPCLSIVWAVACGLFRYPGVTLGPCSNISPSSSTPSSLPSVTSTTYSYRPLRNYYCMKLNKFEGSTQV